MRILGVDPGSLHTGYGCIELRGSERNVVAVGVINTVARAELSVRLLTIFHSLSIVMDEVRPAAVAVEGVFMQKNSRSALILGHARGVALLAAAARGIPVFEYPPAVVKKAAGAGGSAGKGAVQAMVRLAIRVPEAPLRPDAYDALAVALCHAHRSGARGYATVLKPSIVLP